MVYGASNLIDIYASSASETSQFRNRSSFGKTEKETSGVLILFQDQFNTQDAFASTPHHPQHKKKVSMDHYAVRNGKKNARTTDPGRLLSSPKLLRLALPP